MFGHGRHGRGGGQGGLERHGRRYGGHGHGCVPGSLRYHGRNEANARPECESARRRDVIEVRAQTATASKERCPLCDKHCPLDAPACGQGMRLVSRHTPSE